MPVTSPVVALISSPAGSPFVPQLMAGRFAASVSAGVALNAAPTLPVNVWPV